MTSVTGRPGLFLTNLHTPVHKRISPFTFTETEALTSNRKVYYNLTDAPKHHHIYFKHLSILIQYISHSKEYKVNTGLHDMNYIAVVAFSCNYRNMSSTFDFRQ